MEEIRLYTPIKDIQAIQIPFYYSSTFYELLRPDQHRRGHITQNTGQVAVVIYFGLELAGLYPPLGDMFRLTLQPGDSYLGDVPELIPLAGGCLELSDRFGIAEVEIREFF